MRHDAGCWSGQFSFGTCCFMPAAPCFDAVFTFERCCLVPSSEIQAELSGFQARWGVRLGEHRVAKVRCTSPLCKRKALPKHRQRRLQTFALQKLDGVWRRFTATKHDNTIGALGELLAFYVLRVAWQGGQRTAPFDPARSPGAAQLARKEKRVWKKLRETVLSKRRGQYEVCACAGTGYDMIMAMRDNIKRLWLYHPNFSRWVANPSEQAHHLSLLQSCTEEAAETALSDFRHAIARSNCVASDVATNIAVAQACALQRHWARAAELYFLSFALVVMAPWADCLNLAVWDMTADDVVFNAARAMNLATKSAILSPAAAVGTLAWRRSPYALVPPEGQRCDGPAVLDGICLAEGKIWVPPGSGRSVRHALCTEFGAMDGSAWVGESGGIWERLQNGTARSDRRLFLLPVGTPYPNIWHALHWWVPSVALKEELRWNPGDVQLGIVFDSKPRNGIARWRVDHPESEDVKSFLAFHGPVLAALSSQPVLFIAHTKAAPHCFRHGTVGFRSFRYDMKQPQLGLHHIALFRHALAPKRAKRAEYVLLVRRAAGPRHVDLGPLERQLQPLAARLAGGLRSRGLEKLPLLGQLALANQA
ncbi:unnamed protein product, partial [Effrenium voratum]